MAHLELNVSYITINKMSQMILEVGLLSSSKIGSAL